MSNVQLRKTCSLTKTDHNNLIEEFNRVKSLKVNSKSKVSMLQAMLKQLREKQQQQRSKFLENLSTSFSEQESSFSNLQREIEGLEQRILEKRRIKFEINEDIEGIEEDLHHIQNTVDTKKHYDEKLRKKIQQNMKYFEKMRKIAIQSQVKHPVDNSYMQKGLKAVTGIFKGLLV